MTKVNARELMSKAVFESTRQSHVHVDKSCVNEDKSHKLVNWCFEPSQPLGIISGQKETFIKRDIVDNKAEIRPEEYSEKTESCREIFWNEMPLKGP